MLRVHVARICVQRVLVGGFRFGQAASLVVLQGGLDQLGD
jgi:hypothetical protein